MREFYDFLTGVGLWLTFFIFFGGLLARAAFLFGLSRERDKQFYNAFDLRWGFKSILHWLIPLGSVSARRQPVFSLAFWVFHACLLITPLFLEAHNLLWEEAFGWSLPTLPDSAADIMTVILVVCAAFLLIRRIARPEVRILTGTWDYFLLLLTASPFVTGFLAYHQMGDYELMMVLHVLLGEIMLIIVPFSKLGHIILFFFSRAYIGMEMGARREVEGRLGGRVW